MSEHNRHDCPNACPGTSATSDPVCQCKCHRPFVRPMTAHSPEAIAAYPDEFTDSGGIRRSVLDQRSAFDAGVASVRVAQCAADREVLARTIRANNLTPLPNGTTQMLVDALLAPDGPLLVAEQIRREVIDSIPTLAGWHAEEGDTIQLVVKRLRQHFRLAGKEGN